MVSFFKTKYRFFSLFFFLFAILSWLNVFEVGIKKCGIQSISVSNMKYLDNSFKESVQGFLVLSSIKSGIAVLEGSEIGIGFNLQIGDIVQSVYDYIDIAWKAALAGSTILLMTRLVYQTILSIDHYVLSCFFFILCIYFIGTDICQAIKIRYHLLEELVLWSSILSAIVYLILPFSIFAATYFSQKISQPLLTEAMDGFSSMEQVLSSDRHTDMVRQMGDDSMSLMSSLNPRKKFDHFKSSILEMYTNLKGKIDSMAKWTIQLISAYLFDCLVFPFSLFIVLFVLTKGAIAYAVGIRRDGVLARDIGLLIHKENSLPQKSTGLHA